MRQYIERVKEMTITLAKGVHLHMMPSKKFKTVSIKIKFKTPLQVEQMTKRSLLANLLDTNSQHYPTQTDLRKKLSELYGASFATGVSKKGNFHILSMSLNVVNDKFLADTGVVNEAITFLEQLLFYPNVFNSAFHKETFDREVSNLMDEYDARYDNKQAYASMAVRDLYFDQESQRVPSDGREADLKQCTPENVYTAYQEMMEKDQIDIFVLGDINEEQIEAAFQEFTFKDRSMQATPVFYKQAVHKKKEKIEQQSVVQAKLNLVYKTSAYYHQKNYYAAQIFNGLFGGYPHSKLFMNVREKESLAYYASSNLDTFRGTLFVQSGIDQSQAKHVEETIEKQLTAMKKGEFTDEAIEQTKKMIKNGLYQSRDSAHAMIEMSYAMNLIKKISLLKNG